ncbi:MAG: V-type ATP synthase subunit I [Eubacteriales bacterium]|nr:V-type ATP synthase subunit I [Eubacteriales bacterium]
MAIVEMKRVSLIAPKKDEQALLSVIQRMSCIHVTPTEEDEDTGFGRQAAPALLPDVDDTLTRLRWAIDRINKYDTTKKPLLGGKPVISGEEALRLVTERKPELMRTVEALEALERESGGLRSRAARVQAVREQLLPWEGLSIPVEEIKSTRTTVVFLGTAQKSAMEALLAGGELPQLSQVEVLSNVRELCCFYAVAHRDAADQLLGQLKAAGYTPVHLSVEEGMVADFLKQQDQELQEIAARQQAIVQETAAYATEVADMKKLYDSLASEREKLGVTQDLLSSRSTFYLKGWIPAPMTEKLEKQIGKVSPSACISFEDPQEGEEPPTLLHNNPVATPFESIVSGFSLPSYTGFDPTFVMMPFFANFMGMMISDAGYGLVMMIVIPLLILLCKPNPGTRNMMWILAGGGLFTVIWGALYNTWFGFSPWPSVFDPVGNALPVMGVCIGMGAIHLFAGLGVAAYMNIKRGKPFAAIADQFSWFLLVLGLIILVLPMFAPGISPAITTAGQWMALAGVAIILVTAGREKSRNPIKRLFSGLGALYGATSWISDLLSYMRLFGMGLATGVIGMVFNQLIGMLTAGGPLMYIIAVPLFVFCHLFNAGINILGAYVHSCRLQYIEFFGKFYEDGGKPFAPLSTTNRYCFIQDASERT